ncbi:hypothetical protein [Marinicellulosiphila megalodicopiae]|uniref:hypothetical protein n=1 Tax=Marinicellulosiphila megalodicopiae TaxID=2724896 RepID=UPI003BAE3651
MRKPSAEKYRKFIKQGKIKPSSWLKLNPVKFLGFYQNIFNTRNEAVAMAYLSVHYTLEKVAEHLGASYATVSP